MGVRTFVRGAIRSFWIDGREARFHFIHIPKTAGESVRDALLLQRDVSLTSPFHYRYVDVADRVGRHLRFFAIVRNPWSRTASRYAFARQNAGKWPESDPRRRYIETASFSDFVRDRKVLPNAAHPGQPWMGPFSSWLNQIEWIRDENGKIACDCLRMESLTEDLPDYLGRRIKLNRRNATRLRYDYRSMYTDELTEIIAKTFADDIAHFGFSFQSGATRNTFRDG